MQFEMDQKCYFSLMHSYCCEIPETVWHWHSLRIDFQWFSISMLYLCSPRNTRCCWPALLSKTLWRNSSVCFISSSLLSSPPRLNSSETLETSKQRNRCEIYTCVCTDTLTLHTHTYHICSSCLAHITGSHHWANLFGFFSGSTGSEAAGHLETHDVTKAQRGCWEEPGTQTGDHHWG